MARSPLMETINRVAGMVTYVRENLNLEEYDLFLDMVAPQPEIEPVAKKTRKKRATKSAKAQSLSSVIKSSHEAKAEAPPIVGQGCTAMVPGLDVVCGETENNLIHDKGAGYAAYHPFSLTAQPADKKSKKKASAASAAQGLEIDKGAALSASGD